jgi:hypothetical protein
MQPLCSSQARSSPGSPTRTSSASPSQPYPALSLVAGAALDGFGAYPTSSAAASGTRHRRSSRWSTPPSLLASAMPAVRAPCVGSILRSSFTRSLRSSAVSAHTGPCGRSGGAARRYELHGLGAPTVQSRMVRWHRTVQSRMVRWHCRSFNEARRIQPLYACRTTYPRQIREAETMREPQGLFIQGFNPVSAARSTPSPQVGTHALRSGGGTQLWRNRAISLQGSLGCRLWGQGAGPISLTPVGRARKLFFFFFFWKAVSLITLCR